MDVTHEEVLAEWAVDNSLPALDEAQIDLLLEAAADIGSEFFDDLIDTFKEEAEPRITALKEREGPPEPAIIRRDAHFIAGSASNIGLFRLAHICRRIEQLCDAGSLPHAVETGALIEREYDSGILTLQETVRSKLS